MDTHEIKELKEFALHLEEKVLTLEYDRNERVRDFNELRLPNGDPLFNTLHIGGDVALVVQSVTQSLQSYSDAQLELNRYRETVDKFYGLFPELK